jgi:hypothetical protein
MLFNIELDLRLRYDYFKNYFILYKIYKSSFLKTRMVLSQKSCCVFLRGEQIRRIFEIFYKTLKSFR